MAEERLTLLMRARGAANAARDVMRVARRISRLGKDARDADKKIGMFRRGLELLGTRFAMLAIAATLLSVTLGPPLIGVIILLTAAVIALAGALIPLIALGAFAASRFEKMSEQFGSAAFKLKASMRLMKHAWREAAAPGADILMGGLAKAMRMLRPMVKELRGPLTMFARATAQAMQIAARSLKKLGPEFMALIRESAPLMRQFGRLIGPLMGAFVAIARAGLPVLSVMVSLLIDFLRWLRRGTGNMDEFARSAGFLNFLAGVWDGIKAAVDRLWPVLTDLWGIVKLVFAGLKPLLPLVGTALVWAFDRLAGALDWVKNAMKWLGPGPMTAIFVVLGIAIALFGLWTLAVAALNAVLLVNPIVWVILLIAALAAAVVVAYQKWGWFRRAVDNTWSFIRTKLIPALKDAWAWIKRAFGNSIDFIKPKIQWLIRALKNIVEFGVKAINKIGQVADKLGGSKNLLESVPGVGPLARAIPDGRAAGGPVSRGKPYVVGEEGPELFTPSRDGRIIPNGGGDTVVHTHVHLDGKQVAESTLRHARKKKSTR